MAGQRVGHLLLLDRRPRSARSCSASAMSASMRAEVGLGPGMGGGHRLARPGPGVQPRRSGPAASRPRRPRCRGRAARAVDERCRLGAGGVGQPAMLVGLGQQARGVGRRPRPPAPPSRRPGRPARRRAGRGRPPRRGRRRSAAGRCAHARGPRDARRASARPGGPRARPGGRRRVPPGRRLRRDRPRRRRAARPLSRSSRASGSACVRRR